MKTKMLVVMTTMLGMMVLSSLVSAYDMNVSINVNPQPPTPLPISGMAIGAFKTGFLSFIMLLGFIFLGLKLFLTDERMGTTDFLEKVFIFVVVGLLLIAGINIMMAL
jgi:hypothetical protein